MVRAVFVMAPAPVQALDPASLARMRTPILIALGDADTVAPPATNGLVVARLIPDARLVQFPGVGHYDFLSACTNEGRRVVPPCRVSVPQPDTHDRTIAAATAFFEQTLDTR